MEVTVDLLALAAAISAISGGAGVISAHALSKKQKHEDIVQIVRSIVLEHQATCPVGEQVRSDAMRDRQEMVAALALLRTEITNSMQHLTRRLDAIYKRMSHEED